MRTKTNERSLDGRNLMGILADLMGESLMGRTPPVSQAQAANYLADRLGGGRAAARALGVAESTFRGWRGGVISRKGIGTRLTALARTVAPGLADARAGTRTLAIKATVQYSGDRRDRIIHPGRYIPLPIIRRMLTAWVNGNDRTAEAMIHNAVMKYYFSQEDAEDILIYMQPTRVWIE